MLQTDSSPLPATAADQLAVSAQFKREAFRSILSLTAFVVVYLLLITLSVMLVMGCVYAGMALIINVPKLITILLGAGLIGLGIMVFVFLVKFLFAKTETDQSDSIEITQEEQPELVAFIHQIAEDTKTAKPRRIFLSYDVNACVFYNSSFWSMFLPVKKNLKIGLGLVNTVNVSELKAVIAHEFGHFSQRSMKVGSYVYHANQIVYNLLYNNNSYGNSLSAWANIHAVFSLFAALTIKIVQGIQWVLRQMYQVINKSYMALSRQMEFHADLVAATVSGGNNIIASLQRAEIGEEAFQVTLDACDQLWKEKKVVKDIFGCHRVALMHLAQAHNLEHKEGLPVLPELMQGRTVARVNFKNQWASHPTLDERKANLDQLGLNASSQEDSAWVLFANPEFLKHQLTAIVYRNLPTEVEKETIDTTTFDQHFTRQVQAVSLPKLYNGYYDDRQIEVFNIHEALTVPEPDFNVAITFSEEGASLPKKIRLLESDIALLESIEQGQVDTKTFDFDGQKYQRREAGDIKTRLNKELEAQKALLAATDKGIFRYCYEAASVVSGVKAFALKDAYQAYFQLRTDAEAYLEQLDKMMQPILPIFGGQTLGIEQIQILIADLKKQEPIFKEDLRQWRSLTTFTTETGLEAKVEKFLAADYQYFSDGSFFETELNELHELVMRSWTCVQQFLFQEFKKILEVQVHFLSERREIHSLGTEETSIA